MRERFTVVSAFAVVVFHTFVLVFEVLDLGPALGCRAGGCQSLFL